MRHGIWAGTIAAFLATVSVALAPGAVAKEPPSEWAEQGWDKSERDWFHSFSQGSQLMPYNWFRHLENAGDAAPFRTGIPERYGYIARPTTKDNPDGLPVGFAIDRARLQWWIGLTCAACHTGRVAYKGKILQIDGAPTHGDLFGLLSGLGEAMTATKNDAAKLDRLYEKLKPALPPGQQSKPEFTAAFALATDDMAKFVDQSRSPHQWGPARADAFGMIFNRVGAIDLDIAANAEPPAAPVSYPFLWSTNNQTKTQWNGLIDDNTNETVRLARNVGELLGVFGRVPNLSKPGFRLDRYAATVRIDNLNKADKLIGTLLPPKWWKELPPIDPGEIRTGAAIFRSEGCAQCHAPATLPYGGHPITAFMTPLNEIGTDPATAIASHNRNLLTGALAGRRVPPFLGPDLGKSEPAASLLGQVVLGTIASNLFGPTAEGTLPVPVPGRRTRAEPEQRATITNQGDRSPLAYKGGPLEGIWATAPYLHNGSVPDLYSLFLPPAQRPKNFRVGSIDYDPEKGGFVSDEKTGSFTFDTSLPGNSNAGHNYGTALTDAQRKALVAYLKSL